MRNFMVAITYVALLLLAVMFISTPIIAQSSWGIGSELHTSRLTPMKSLQKIYKTETVDGVPTRIESELLHKVGFKHDFSVSPVLYYRMQLQDKLIFETGLGYAAIRYTLYFEREAKIGELIVFYSSFHMALQYLYVPFKLQYRIPVNNKSSVHNWTAAFGLKNKLLISYDDNYNDLNVLSMGWYYMDVNFYSRYVASIELSLVLC